MFRKKIFALLAFFTAMLCLLFDGYIFYFSLKTEKFVETEAVFLEKEGRRGFSYEISGKVFFSPYYSVVDYVLQKQELDRIYFKKGEKTICYYSTENPSLPFLKKGIVVEKYILTSLVLAVIFIIIAWQYWKDGKPESCGIG